MATMKEISGWFIGVLVTTWLAVMLMISGHIAAVQLLPTTFWLDLKSVKVYESGGQWWVDRERTVKQLTEARVQFEIHETDLNGGMKQFCTISYFAMVEPDTNLSKSPISSAVTGCDISDPLMQGKPLYLQVTYVIEVGYGFNRSVTIRSNTFTLNVPPKQR